MTPRRRGHDGLLAMKRTARVEQRISETEAIDEGLYVLDPAVLAPQCGTVKLTVYSEAEPDKGDTRAVDPKVLQQARDRLTTYRDRLLRLFIPSRKAGSATRNQALDAPCLWLTCCTPVRTR